MTGNEAWNIADKTGTVLTIVGFFLAIATLIIAGSIKSALKNKVRVTEAIADLAKLVAEIRNTLKDWDNHERSGSPDAAELEKCAREISTMFYQALAHVQNIRPRLDSMQKKSADDVVGSIFNRKGYWFWVKLHYRVDSSNYAWEVHNKLQGFSVHLQGLAKDRAAGGV